MPGKAAILIIVTSHDRIDEEHPTGLWLEEFAIPYRMFTAQGYAVTVASLGGGAAPIDPRSLEAGESEVDQAAIEALKQTHRLAEIDPEPFAALFFPGGHGTMYDLPHNGVVSRIVEAMAAAGKVIAAVCHGPAGLIGATDSDGLPLVGGHTVTAFTNAEEEAVALADKMPFLLENRLRELGADFKAADMWEDHAVQSGLLITGQNPQSSASVARLVLEALQ